MRGAELRKGFTRGVLALGLKSKITITVSILVVLLMSAVAYVTLSYFEERLKASISQNQFVMVTALASEIDRKLLAAHDQLIDAALHVPPEALKDPDRAQAFLDSLTGLQRIFDNQVLILTPEGKLLAESPFLPNRRGFDASFRGFYKRTVATKSPVISDPYISSLDRKHPAVIMTAPLVNAKGELDGLLLGSMDLMGANLLQDLSRVTIGRSGYLYLMTRETRTMIMHPDPSRILNQSQPGTNSLLDQAVNGFEGTGETVNAYGTPVLTSIKRLKVNDWILAANYPISEAHEIIFDLKKKFFIAAIIGILCVITIVYYLIKRMTFPLVVLARHVETLPTKTGANKLVAIKSQDEIGKLAQSFNRMVAELDQQQQALQQSEQRYRTIYDAANDAIFIHDLDTGAILDVNQRMCEMYGFTREEARQLTPLDLSAGVPPYAPENALEWIAKAARGEPQHFEWKAKDRQGRLFWTEIKMRRARIAGVDRLLATVSDVSERKQQETALRDSEKRLSQIIDFLPDATFAIDLSGKVIAWNHAIEEMTGVSAEEMLGKDNHEYGIPFYGTRRPILIDLVFKPDEEIGKQYAFVKKEGDYLLAEADVPVKGTYRALWGIARPLFDSEGNAVGAIESIRDITERKHADDEKVRLESLLLQAQKMEAIGTLAGGIAHDFNNILTALIGYASLLQLNLKDNPRMCDYADQILAASEKAANLTQRLLAFSRKQIMERKPTGVNAIVKGAENLLQRLLSEDINFKVVLANTDITVMADIVQIDQVLLNLATNARDAMPNGGSLKIETSSVLVDETFIHERGLGEKGLYAVISVSDSGIGMDEKTREKIFDPFFTTKEVGKGTGLGLSTVYGVLQQHKGFVEVLSQPGRGTTFHVYLPAINQIADSESAQKVAYSEGGCETILVAEDNDSSRTLVKRVLAGKGYTVIEAVDGDDAVQKYSQFRHQISMLLLDVVMPQKNGMEAYNEIRTLEPSIKVLFMSGYTGEVVFDKGMKDDSFDFISKPFAPNDLLLQIRKLLDKQH